MWELPPKLLLLFLTSDFPFFVSRATFVGLAYGLATIASSSIIVPMASHSINNIIGGLLWRFTNNSEREM
jgi:membrane protease YdiL (CAAX protease family)